MNKMDNNATRPWLKTADEATDEYSRRTSLAIGVLTLMLSLLTTAIAADATSTDAKPAQTGEETVPTKETKTGSGEEDGTDTSAADVLPPSIDDLPWELRPYRVHISLALADRRVMNQAFAERLIASLKQSIDGMIGPYWKPTIAMNDWLFPQTQTRLQRLTNEEMISRFRETKHEKVIVVVMEADGPRYRLTGCEWDRSTESLGPIRERLIVDRRRAGTVVFELIRELFRPVGMIEMDEETTAELRARGAELLSPESPQFPFHVGDLLTGHFRYLDRDDNVRQIQAVPWTYLKVDGITRSRITAMVDTAFSNPFSGSRRRVELLALKVRPAYPATRLSLVPRTNPNKPLVGVRVRVFAELPSKENPQPDRVDLMTDRDGTVTVSSSPETPLRRLIIHSGGAVLSNVPFVPGVEPAITMELPDDSPRLQVEGNLAMVQGDLIDQVSRRVVMMARAVALAKREQFDEADKLMQQVDEQPSIASYESRILAIRVPAVDQAKANRDRSQEKRIRIMCQELVDLVNKYLDRDMVKETKVEIDELKKLAGV